jgi:hypothetical protein
MPLETNRTPYPDVIALFPLPRFIVLFTLGKSWEEELGEFRALGSLVLGRLILFKLVAATVGLLISLKKLGNSRYPIMPIITIPKANVSKSSLNSPRG